MKASASTMAALIMSLLIMSSLMVAYIAVHRESLGKLRNLSEEARMKIYESSKNVKLNVFNNYLWAVTEQPPIDVLSVIALFPNGTYTAIEGYRKGFSKVPIADLDTAKRITDDGGILVILLDGKYLVVDFTVLNNLLKSRNVSTSETFQRVWRERLKPYLVLGSIYDKNSFLNNPIPGDDQPYANYRPILLNFLSNNTDIDSSSFTVNYLGNGYIRVNIHGDMDASMQVYVPILLYRDLSKPRKLIFHITLNPTYCIFQSYYVYMNIVPEIYVVPVIDYLRSPLPTEVSELMFGDQLLSSTAKTLYVSKMNNVILSAKAYLTSVSKCRMTKDEATLILTFNPNEIFSDLPDELNAVVALVGFQAAMWRSTRAIINYSIIKVGVFDASDTSITINDESYLNKPLILVSSIPDLTLEVIGSNGSVLKTYKPTNVLRSSYKLVRWLPLDNLGIYNLRITKASDDVSTRDLPVADNTPLGVIKVNYSYNAGTIILYNMSRGGYEVSENITYTYYYVFYHRYLAHLGIYYGALRESKVTYANVPQNAIYSINVTNWQCPPTYISWRPVLSAVRTYAYFEWYDSCYKEVLVTTSYNTDYHTFSVNARLDTGEDYIIFDVLIFVNETKVLIPQDEGILKVYKDELGNVAMLLIDIKSLLKPLIR